MFTLEHVEDALRKHEERYGIVLCTVCRGWQSVVHSMLTACIARNQNQVNEDDIIETLEKYAQHCATFESKDS